MTTPTQQGPTSQALQNLRRAANELSVVAKRARQTADLIPTMLDDFTDANHIRALGHTVYLCRIVQVGRNEHRP